MLDIPRFSGYNYGMRLILTAVLTVLVVNLTIWSMGSYGAYQNGLGDEIGYSRGYDTGYADHMSDSRFLDYSADNHPIDALVVVKCNQSIGEGAKICDYVMGSSMVDNEKEYLKHLEILQNEN